MRDHIAAEMLHALAVLDCDEEPTLDLLLAGGLNVVLSDWINRSGPAPAWERVLAGFTTPQLLWLAKSLILLERDSNWTGGSAAASIWFFRAYQAREDGDANKLADWILCHRDDNPWAIFGVRPYARSLEAYLQGREWHHQQYEARLQREALERQRVADKARIKQERARQRRLRGQERSLRRVAFVERLAAMNSRDRLIFLATDRSFPLEVVPETIVRGSLQAAPGLTAEIRSALLGRLDRRKARRWRSFRKSLQF